MKIFITGGTGSIGSAVVEVLQARNHAVYALGRTPKACKLLSQRGAIPVPGDLLDPASWIEICDSVDGVVHAAAAWGDQMGSIDRGAAKALLNRLTTGRSDRPFIYTGGCWMYGETGNLVATEDSPFNPLDSFASVIPTIQSVISASRVRGMIIHPAMVYERDGGVFEYMFEDAKNLGYIRVVRGENVRWPLVHRLDLAQVYVLMLEQGQKGDVYNVATNHGVPIGKITRTIAKRLGISLDPVVFNTESAIIDIGSWAEGYALDQQMSGEKARQVLNWRPHYDDVLLEIS